MKPRLSIRSQAHIVVIDDDVVHLELVKLRLRDIECEAAYFDNELDGLAYLRRNRPDILVVDQCMPRLNGIDLLSALEPAFADQVFLVSGGPISSEIERLVRACGAISLSKDELLEKGFFQQILGDSCSTPQRAHDQSDSKRV